MSEAARPACLWSPRGRWGSVALVAVGGACALLASGGARREGVPDHQVKFAVLSVVGVVLAGAGAVGWYLDGRRHVAMRASVVLAEYSTLSGLVGSRGSAAGPSATRSTRVVVVGRALYHRPDCALTADRPLTEFDADASSADEQRPCPVCEP